MKRIWRCWSRLESFCACFPFYLSQCKVRGSMDSSRSVLKVVLQILNARTDGANSNLRAQLSLTFGHCLWVYDYLLTLGDEVGTTTSSSTERLVLTAAQIEYAWSGRKSWSGFTFISSWCLMNNTVVRQHSRCSLLYDIPDT